MKDTRHHFRRFVLEWLEVDELERSAKSAALHPEYDALKSHMLAETSAFVDEVMVAEGASISALLTAGFASVDPPLARFYGLKTWGARASLANSGRIGILQQASFLAAHAHEDFTSPVKRGDFVMKKLLCAPTRRPAELGIDLVFPPPSTALTTRERFSQHVVDPSCASCHDAIDAFGFPFETFDAAGRARTTENARPVNPVTEARVGGKTVRLENSVELSRILAKSPEVKECFARQAFRYFSAQHDAGVERSYLGLRDALSDERVRQPRRRARRVRSERALRGTRGAFAMTRFDRRAFLSALGASGALLGLERASGAGAPARTAATSGAYGPSGKPLRLVCVYMPHGRAHELWQPREGFDIAFPDATLAPFDDAATYSRSFKNELLVVDGVDLTAGIAVGTTGHDAPRAIFTGSGANGKNASIEQFLADEQRPRRGHAAHESRARRRQRCVRHSLERELGARRHADSEVDRSRADVRRALRRAARRAEGGARARTPRGQERARRRSFGSRPTRRARTGFGTRQRSSNTPRRFARSKSASPA